MESHNEDESYTAILSHPDLGGKKCFTMWYYMFGSNVPKLGVRHRINGEAQSSTFYKYRSPGDLWEFTQMTFDDEKYDVRPFY